MNDEEIRTKQVSRCIALGALITYELVPANKSNAMVEYLLGVQYESRSAIH